MPCSSPQNSAVLLCIGDVLPVDAKRREVNLMTQDLLTE